MLSAFLGFVAAHVLYLALHLETGSFPKPLSARRERELFQALRGGERLAREKIICHNLRLVAHIAKKYYSASEEQDDLVSIGTIGLIKAVDSFDSEKGARFATYAARCIENELLMHFRAGKKTQGTLSLCDPIDGEGDGALTLNDVMADPFQMDEAYETKEETAGLYRAIQDLAPREARILTLRYGLGGQAPLTQQEVADRLSISRSYVSRIEKKAIGTVRGELEKEQ